jgi:hypothetical protein
VRVSKLSDGVDDGTYGNLGNIVEEEKVMMVEYRLSNVKYQVLNAGLPTSGVQDSKSVEYGGDISVLVLADR